MIICICNQANEINCKNCPKGLDIKPDHAMFTKNWKRDLSKYNQKEEPKSA